MLLLTFSLLSQMQKLMKAAREGTKDGLEKTKAAVKRGRSLIRTRSFMAAGGKPRAGQGDGLRGPPRRVAVGQVPA